MSRARIVKNTEALQQQAADATRVHEFGHWWHKRLTTVSRPS